MSSSAHAYATFDNDDLCTMHSAYEAACARLNISSKNGDPARRERVAVAIIGSAEGGERDLRRLEDSAVRQYLAGSDCQQEPTSHENPRAKPYSFRSWCAKINFGWLYH